MWHRPIAIEPYTTTKVLSNKKNKNLYTEVKNMMYAFLICRQAWITEDLLKAKKELTTNLMTVVLKCILS